MTRIIEKQTMSYEYESCSEILCDWCGNTFYHHGMDKDVDVGHGEVHSLKVEYYRGGMAFETNRYMREDTEVVKQWADLCKKCRPKLFTLMKQAGIKIQREVIKEESYIPDNVKYFRTGRRR